MAKALKVKPEDFARLSEMWRWYERAHGRLDSQTDLSRRGPRDGAFGDRTRVYNDSGEEIPAYGCMAVSGVHTDPAYIKVTKPSTTFRRQYLPNGASPIPVGGTGSIPTRLYYKWLYNAGTPANDEGFGPTPGEWYLTKNYPCVSVSAGIFNADDKVLWGTVQRIDEIIGKLHETLVVGSTAIVNIWVGSGTESVLTSVQLSDPEAKDWFLRAGTITAGTKVAVRWPNGRPYVMNASCGP